MLLLLDFDGTITERDTLDLLVAHHAPDVFERTEAALRAGSMTLNEAIAEQFAAVPLTNDEALAEVRSATGLRPGLPELVDFCRRRFVDVVVVSAGFVELIEPLLADQGVAVPIVANSAIFSRNGCRVRFLERARCSRCGEECKRAEVERLAQGRLVAYAGDGWSDRCAAQDGDLVFARGTLARHLGGLAVPFTAFETMHDVREVLERFLDVGAP